MVVAPVLMKPVTADGVAVGLDPSTRAAMPATCGDAIEVPLIVLVAEELVYQADVMELPGAKTSTQLP